MNIRDRIEQEVGEYSRHYGHNPEMIEISIAVYENLLNEWPQYKADEHTPILGVHIHVRSIKPNEERKANVVLTSPYGKPDWEFNL